jgi:hypothetical protein
VNRTSELEMLQRLRSIDVSLKSIAARLAVVWPDRPAGFFDDVVEDDTADILEAVNASSDADERYSQPARVQIEGTEASEAIQRHVSERR